MLTRLLTLALTATHLTSSFAQDVGIRRSDATILDLENSQATSSVEQNGGIRRRVTTRSNKIEIAAVIDQDNFRGTLTGKQESDTTIAEWKLDIEFMNATICAEPMSWHIHEFALPTNGTCGETGGHWDPTFGCTGASQYKNTICADINTLTGRANPQSCDPVADITTCEMGDMSGKLQYPIDPSEIAGKRKWKKRFDDPYVTNLDQVQALSVVFHCNRPRVACGNFALIEGREEWDM